ncbi:MinD/ParA family ATP-binding protein [Corynebacterium cystitidis]|uniref:MinD/ParA family ATP-binding protein n=2 Tax=Corynebacterium cystitidis TaxID=35757 RepID=UPI00211E576B|nr:MinD/ParA family protein [Corynebacterium cystitidis]
MTHMNDGAGEIPAWLKVDTASDQPAQAAPAREEEPPLAEEPAEASVVPQEALEAQEAPQAPTQDIETVTPDVDTPVSSADLPREPEVTTSTQQKEPTTSGKTWQNHTAAPAESETGSRRQASGRGTGGGAHRKRQWNPACDEETYELTPPAALDQSNLVNTVKPAPQRGWRKVLYTLTFGAINLGSSKREKEENALLEKIRTPLQGDYRIAVMSLKGGVGKTTTTVTLGGVFAEARGDRVIAIDANPDLGTLAQRVSADGAPTIRELLAATDTSRYPLVRNYTTQANSRLEVIGSERDPAVSETFSDNDYRRAIDILQHHYNIILTDCGTGLMHSAMNGVLELSNMLVLVTSPALDGAQSAAATLDWLNLHGYEQLAANAVVVVSSSSPQQSSVDFEQLVEHFRSRTRAVHTIPFDPHLSEGGSIDLDLLAAPTLKSYRELAATIAQDFSGPNR